MEPLYPAIDEQQGITDTQTHPLRRVGMNFHSSNGGGTVTKQTGAFSWQGLRSLGERLRLAWRLLRDPRVPLWTKVVPVAALLYLIWPLDIVADVIPGLGQLDDITLLLVATEAFVRLCPRHLRSATGEPGPQEMGEVVEGEYRVVDDLAIEANGHHPSANQATVR